MSAPKVAPIEGEAVFAASCLEHEKALLHAISEHEQSLETLKQTINTINEKLHALRQYITVSGLIRPDESEKAPDSSAPSIRELAADWYEFVEQRLHEFGSTTVEALYAEAPAEWRSAYEAIPSTNTAVFRARRLLRRSPIFEVDRATGSVHMEISQWPPVPAFSQSDPIIVSFGRAADGTPMVMLRSNNSDKLIPYAEFLQQLKAGKTAWINTPSDGLLPIAVGKLMNRKVRVSSYSDEGWTDHWKMLRDMGSATIFNSFPNVLANTG